MKHSLDVLSDLSEVIKYNLQDYPVFANIGNLRYFYKYSVASHWHKDIEISLLLNGDMDYFVNGESLHVKDGQCIFINSKRLHYNYSGAQQNCRYLVVTINLDALTSRLHPLHQFIQDKFGDFGDDYIILTGKEEWHKRLFDLLFQIYDELHSENCNLLFTTSYAISVCGEIAEHISTDVDRVESDASWMTAGQMTGFIHKNYDENISLPDIAAAGGVCKSTCCKLFRDYVKQTPISYLINYRIQKSLEMLRETSCSISEIAMRCGFQSASYFTQTFREQLSVTPSAYRKSKALGMI